MLCCSMIVVPIRSITDNEEDVRVSTNSATDNDEDVRISTNIATDNEEDKNSQLMLLLTMNRVRLPINSNISTIDVEN